MECEHIEKISDDMKQVAKILYVNPRIGKVTISVETLLGVSVTHYSDGDPESPEMQILKRKEIQRNHGDNNALRNYQRSAVYHPKSATTGGSSDLQKRLQQWPEDDRKRESSSTDSMERSEEVVPKSWV